MRNARILTSLLRTTPAALLLGATLAAQNSPQTIPQGFLGSVLTNTSGNSWPFNNTTTAGFRTQFVYHGAQVKHGGPILINRIRFKIYNASINFTPTTYNNTTISLSTCPAPQTHANMSTTWANNIGKDVKVIFQGNFVSLAKVGTNLWFVDIKLPSAFLYDKSKGDLTFEFLRKGTVVKTSTTAQAYRNGTSAVTHGGRLYGSATSTTGSKDTNVGIIELTYTPAKGLFSDFSAAPTTGPGPLKVQFTDKTFTSNGPIKTWAWDLDGDNTIDSKVQNPTFIYPKKGWDATYNVTLTTTDGTNPTSTITKKAFILVDPSNATAVNFGKASTNKPVIGPIGLPKNNAHYSSNSTRGLWFKAPTAFVISGFEASNTYTAIKQTHQTVTCYVFATSGTKTPTAADIRYHGTGPSNTILKPAKPITVQKGEIVAVLGACHIPTSSNRNSYGAGPFNTTVMGQSMSMHRLTYGDHRATKGIGGSLGMGTAGSLGRIDIHVPGNINTSLMPSLTTIGLPKLGTTPKLDAKAGIPGAQGGILLMGAARLPAPVPTPWGNLLVKPPFTMALFVANGTAQVPFPIPSNVALKGVMVDFQHVVWNVTSNTFGMSNGTEWFVGK